MQTDFQFKPLSIIVAAQKLTYLQRYSGSSNTIYKRSFSFKPLSIIVAAQKLTYLQCYSGSSNTIYSAITTKCISQFKLLSNYIVTHYIELRLKIVF